DLAVDASLLAAIIDHRGERELAAFGRLENAGRLQQISCAVRCHFEPLDGSLLGEIDAHEAGTGKIRAPVEGSEPSAFAAGGALHDRKLHALADAHPLEAKVDVVGDAHRSEEHTSELQ